MAPPILTLRNIHLTFGGTPLLEGAELFVSKGDRLCLVGRNGSGKSTLLKIAAGDIEPDHGERFVQPGVSIRYLPQEPDLSGFDTVRDFAEKGLSPNDDPYRAQYLLEQLGLTGDENPATLSGGEARRAALARALAPAPDILLLDEPTNHLDLPAIEWLESELRATRSALVLISHDRRFLENLSNATIWIHQGAAERMEKGFSHFEEWRDTTLEQQELDSHKLDRKIVAEEHWVRYGVTARRKRNQGRMRALQDLRSQRRDQRRAPGSVKMTVAEGQTSGKQVMEAKGISKTYGGEAVGEDGATGADSKTVVAEFSTRIMRGDRIGLVGPNGAGKTTLLNMLTGTLTPDTGTVKLGSNLQMVSLDQRREDLNPEWTLSDALTGGRGDMVFVDDQPRHVISYMKDFLFAPEQVRTPIHALSGGERGRLMLARALARPSNLLVLDEPTNDLDIETLDLLQEMLADYPGTVLLVSHDRDFLDRVVTSVIVSEGDGEWGEYPGGYTDMMVQRKNAASHKAEESKSAKATASAGTVSTGTPSTAAASSGSKGGKAAASKRKLTFKEKHALETLPTTIGGLQTDIVRLGKELADPELYARDPETYERTAADLETAQVAFTEAEDTWLGLEMLREELEGG